VLPLEAGSVGTLVAAAIAYSVDDRVRNCRDVLVHGAQGAPFGTWNAEVSEVRHNHETTGAGDGAKQMSHVRMHRRAEKKARQNVTIQNTD